MFSDGKEADAAVPIVLCDTGSIAKRETARLLKAGKICREEHAHVFPINTGALETRQAAAIAAAAVRKVGLNKGLSELKRPDHIFYEPRPWGVSVKCFIPWDQDIYCMRFYFFISLLHLKLLLSAIESTLCGDIHSIVSFLLVGVPDIRLILAPC